MHYFFEDLTGIAAATLLSVVLLVMPGFGIAELMTRAGLIRGEGTRRTCWALALAPTFLPAVDALVLRWLGFPAALLLHAGLAAVGIKPALNAIRRVPPRWWSAIAGCWLLVLWANADFDWNGRLYQSELIVDGVKHAAVIGSLAQFGVPLHDPFFARPGIAGYYYYFYIGPALIHWLAGPLVDSRAAFASGSFVTLLAFPAMLLLLADEAALIRAGARRAFFRVLLFLCCLSGLDLLAGVWIWARTGEVIAQLDWWSEEVRWLLTSILLVPHHMTAVVAVFVGCLVLAGRGHPVLRAGIAGMAFATAFGCSTWIALAAVPILGLWWVYERLATRTTGMWALPLSGVVALVASLPQIADIQSGRAPTGPPLIFYMRPLGPIRVLPQSVTDWIVHLAVTPGGYLVEFGIFALGTIVFLARGGVAASRSTPIGRLLLVAAPVALLLVTFVRSSVLYNDFGWRSVWFAQVPAMLWTASVLSSRPSLIRTPAWAAAMTLGLAASLWDVTGLRLIRPYYFLTFANAHPDVDFDSRGAYRWIDRNAPAGVLVQHNPEAASRALDFGLYSDRPVAVADGEARLFGAPQAAVEHRLALLAPIFERAMPASELRQRAAVAGIGGILLTSADPLWRSAGGPPSDWTCDYRSAHSCVMLLEKR